MMPKPFGVTKKVLVFAEVCQNFQCRPEASDLTGKIISRQ